MAYTPAEKRIRGRTRAARHPSSAELDAPEHPDDDEELDELQPSSAESLAPEQPPESELSLLHPLESELESPLHESELESPPQPPPDPELELVQLSAKTCAVVPQPSPLDDEEDDDPEPDGSLPGVVPPLGGGDPFGGGVVGLVEPHNGPSFASWNESTDPSGESSSPTPLGNDAATPSRRVRTTRAGARPADAAARSSSAPQVSSLAASCSLVVTAHDGGVAPVRNDDDFAHVGATGLALEDSAATRAMQPSAAPKYLRVSDVTVTPADPPG